MAKGNLYILSAPSGAGKSSLIKALLENESVNAKVSVSHTTRQPRPGEKGGVHYHFIDHDTFKQLIAEQAFLEYAEVFGNYYGTSRAMIEAELAQGVDVFLDIDWQGARQIRKLMPEVRTIFILPPSLAELEKRLVQRGQDSAEVVQARMAKAISEMSHYDEYDYVIVNDDFNEAVNALKTILSAEQLTCSAQQARYQDLITTLLAKDKTL